jgi:hypothetical protein
MTDDQSVPDHGFSPPLAPLKEKGQHVTNELSHQ